MRTGRPRNDMEMAVAALFDIRDAVLDQTPPDVREELGGRRLPDGFTKIELGMTNFNHSIDEGFGDALKGGPVFGSHAAWEFRGKIWFADELFHEEVWRYRSYQETISAPTLEDLMEVVNAKWGTD